MKLYISGPMTGIDAYNEPAFREAAAGLQAHGYEYVLPHDLDVEHPVTTWGSALGRDVQIIADDATIDGILLLPGWEKSDGARIEVLTAYLRKKIVAYPDATGAPMSIHRNEVKHLLRGAL